MAEFEKLYWNGRYARNGHSGYGSYGEQLKKKLGWLSQLEGIRSISEFGCGDFNFGTEVLKLFPEANYLGCDVSDFIVEKNRKDFPKHNFIAGQDILPADLVLCVDVLFHVIYPREVEEILNKLEKAWTKYLVITAYERDEEMGHHVRIRKFDYKRFGEPVIKEVVEEEGTLYFYVFKK